MIVAYESSNAWRLGKACVRRRGRQAASANHPIVTTTLMKRKSRIGLKPSGFRDVVPGAGIEPARLAAGDFESPASTNFTTRAQMSEASNYGTVWP
jgi:hypothetical protein